MKCLIADFHTAIKILMWRESKMRQYNDEFFLNGLRYANSLARERKIREILESVDSRHLVKLTKFSFIQSESEFTKLLFDVLSCRASEINEGVSQLKKKLNGNKSLSDLVKIEKSKYTIFCRSVDTEHATR